MRLSDCHNLDDFRTLARRRLPGPVFHYIDGAADDEITRKRNREAYNACDLVPNVLAGVETIEPPVADPKRFESFMRRGEIAEQKLGDKKKALEMFRRAAALSGALDTTADANWGEYVRGKVRELGAEK